MPCNWSSPVVANDRCPLDSQRIKKANHIARQMEDRILIDSLRPICLAVTAHVGRDSSITLAGKRLQLMTPGVPRFGKSVAKQHGKSRSSLRKVHPDAVGLDKLMFEGHCELPSDPGFELERSSRKSKCSGRPLSPS